MISLLLNYKSIFNSHKASIYDFVVTCIFGVCPCIVYKYDIREIETKKCFDTGVVRDSYATIWTIPNWCSSTALNLQGSCMGASSCDDDVYRRTSSELGRKTREKGIVRESAQSSRQKKASIICSRWR